MGVRHSRGQWLSWIVDQRLSGQTISAFCDSVGIKENSFYRWRAKFIAEGESLDKRQVMANDGGSTFVPLSVVTSEGVEIDLPCGAVVRVPSDDASIDRVLRVLLDATGSPYVDSDGGAAC